MSETMIAVSEPWLDRKKLADHYSCSVRSIEIALSKGMPHAMIFGRAKFQLSSVDPWLREHGFFLLPVDGGCSVVTGSANGTATALTAPPHDREDESR